MSHLDEGRLHAYLDGEASAGDQAHLDVCSECRGRLDETRRVRDAAGAILRAASPSRISTPPFEEVLARAGRKPRSMRSAIVLGWAASLALALTVGWYARGVMLAPTEAEVAGGAGGTEAAAETGDVQAAPVEARPPAARPSDQLAQRATAGEEPMQPPAAGAGAGAMQDRTVANVTAAESRANVDTEPKLETERHVADVPAPAMRTAPAPAATQPSAALREAETGALANVWVTVTPAEAERRLGGPLATIPGLPSLGTTVFGSGSNTVARTIQVLGPGQTIELVQQRRSATRAPSAAVATPQPGRAMRDEPDRGVTVEWEGFSVTGRALVPADSLRVLLAKLRPY